MTLLACRVGGDHCVVFDEGLRSEVVNTSLGIAMPIWTNPSDAFTWMAGSYKAQQIVMTPSGVLIAAISNSTLLAVQTVISNVNSDIPPNVIPKEEFGTSIEIPYRVSQLVCNDEFILVSFDSTDPELSIAVVKIIRIHPVGSSDHKLEISLFRKIGLAHTKYFIAGSLVFAGTDTFNFCRFEQGILEVGSMMVGKDELLTEVSEDGLPAKFQVLVAKWNHSLDSVLFHTNSKKLILYRKSESKEPWVFCGLEVETIEFVAWHPSDLSFVIGANGRFTVFDLALNELVNIEVNNDVDVFLTHTVWLRGSVKNKESSESQRRDNIPMNKPLHSPMVVRYVPTAIDSTIPNYPIEILAFDKANRAFILPMPVRIPMQPRLILQHHLNSSNISTRTRLDRCTFFTLSLRKSHDAALRLNAFQLVFRELLKAGDTSGGSLIDLLDHWMVLILSAMQAILSDTVDSALSLRRLGIVESCEVRFVNQKCRLGQLELAYQFVHKLTEKRPQSFISAVLFDQISVWACAFNQSDTISPMARSMAQKARKLHDEIVDSDESEVDDSDSATSVNDESNDDSSNDDSSNDVSSNDVSSIDASSNDDSSSSDGANNVQHASVDDLKAFDLEDFKIPRWKNGTGGSIVPEALGILIEEIGHEITIDACIHVDQLLTRWSEIGDSKLLHNEAVELGILFECKGEFSNARQLYRHHDMITELEQLETMEMQTSNLDYIPNVLVKKLEPEFV